MSFAESFGGCLLFGHRNQPLATPSTLTSAHLSRGERMAVARAGEYPRRRPMSIERVLMIVLLVLLVLIVATRFL